MNIRYVDCRTDGMETVYKQLCELTQRTKKQIVAVNSHLNEPTQSRSKKTWKASRVRRSYYDLLLQLAGDRGIQYRRILQSATIERPLPTLKVYAADLEYRKHFTDILTVPTDDAAWNAVLLLAPVRSLSTFVLIDDTYLFWQIDELRDDEWRMHSALIVEDPQHKVVQQFRTLSHALINDPNTRAVKVSEWQEATAATAKVRPISSS